MKRTELVILVAVIAFALGAWAIWLNRWQAQNARRKEMHSLYAFASGGDLEKVKRLSEYPSPEATQWLEKLAKRPDATPDTRVAAIIALGGKPSVNHTVLSDLLYIDQPFVVRHASAEVLQQRRCHHECISTALHGLHAIWKGEPAFEVGLSAVEHNYGVRGDPELEAKIDAELRSKTEQDYWILLNSNPCSTRDTLKKEYGSETMFIETVQSKAKPCSS